MGTISPSGGMIPLPIPPNYTGTIAPADVAAVDTLAIRLWYNGSVSCNITEILLWQQVEAYGEIWNRTQNKISPPRNLISPETTFDFLVEVENYYNAFVVSGTIFLQIKTLEYGVITRSSEIPHRLPKLISWPLSTTTSTTSSIICGFDLFIVIIFSIAIIYFRRKTRS